MSIPVCVIVAAGPGNGLACARRFSAEGYRTALLARGESALRVLEADMPASRRMLPDKPDEFFAKPGDIAESVFFLTRQPPSAWTFELDLRPSGERW